MSFLLKCLFFFYQGYCWIVRPRTLGVRALVFDQKQRVLLVKHTYRTGWFLPGGAVDRGESVEAAVRRELREETHVACESGSLELCGVFYNPWLYKNDHVVVFLVEGWQEQGAFQPNLEIEACCFFEVNNLPPDISPGAKRRILERLGQKEPRVLW